MMKEHKEASAAPAQMPPALNHEHSIAHSIGKSFASAHGADHTGAQMSASAGPCGLCPMTGADDNSKA